MMQQNKIFDPAKFNSIKELISKNHPNAPGIIDKTKKNLYWCHYELFHTKENTLKINTFFRVNENTVCKIDGGPHYTIWVWVSSEKEENSVLVLKLTKNGNIYKTKITNTSNLKLEKRIRNLEKLLNYYAL